MKKINKALIISIVFIAIIFISQSLFSQTTKLNYKVKGKTTYAVDITLSSQSGAGDLTPEEYFTYADVYFLFQPSAGSKRDVFRESEIVDILSKVVLVQNQNTTQSRQPRYLLNEKGKVDRIVVAYSKENFVAHEEFSFSSGGFFSDKMKLAEKYLASYKKYLDLYEKAKKQYEEGDYKSAFNNYLEIAMEGVENTEVASFSFYKPVIEKQIPLTIDLFIDKSKSKFQDASAKFEADKNFESLSECGKVMDEIQNNAKTFEDLKQIDLPEVKSTIFNLNDFLEGLKKQSQENIVAFKKEKMEFFVSKNYDDYKFRVFIDLLCRTLLYKESLSLVNELEPVNISRLDKFPEKKKELLSNWEADFQIYIELINQNIRNNSQVLSSKIMDNLKNLIEKQRQPYYEIFAAFNTFQDDIEESKALFQSALTKCSDDRMIDFIENWILSFRMTEKEIDPDFLAKINEGTELIHKERYTQADNLFNQLMRMASGFAPTWYHSGEIKYYMGESFSAERFFNKALEIYPQYIAPRKFILKIFENDSSYKQYLENANKSLTKFDIWYFHFNKAKALYYNKKYNDAITEIKEECLTKNPWDLEQYYLLGDTYFKMGDYDNAKVSYGKILDFNPFLTDTKKFDDRMRKVSEKMEQKAKAKSKVVVPKKKEPKKEEEKKKEETIEGEQK